MSETTVPVDRPTAGSEEVLQLAAAMLCSQMGGECNTPDAVASVAKALRNSSGAFEVARALERDCWSIDDSVLEVLLEADGTLIQAHYRVVAEWVAARHIKPLRAVGAPVTTTYRGVRVDGEISRIDSQHANYTVYCPDLGHVRSGIGTNGIIVPFESVHGLCPGPETFSLETESEAFSA